MGSEAEAAEAMRLAVAALPDLGKRPEDYRLVSVQNLLSGRDASPSRWRIGFKTRSLIPSGTAGKIGKGGEFFVEVDTESAKVTPARGGD
jgi:hypothetical protein